MISLKELRMQNNLTQKDLAEKLGIAQNTVSQWENGTRSINTETAKVIADLFNVSIDTLCNNGSDFDGNVMVRLKELRKEKGLSQKELADIFSVSQGTIANWENGRRIMDIETAKSISDFFGVTIDYLLGKEKQPEEITFDDFTYSFHNETKELTEENKQKLLELARFFKEQQEKGK